MVAAVVNNDVIVVVVTGSADVVVGVAVDDVVGTTGASVVFAAPNKLLELVEKIKEGTLVELKLLGVAAVVVVVPKVKGFAPEIELGAVVEGTAAEVVVVAAVVACFGVDKLAVEVTIVFLTLSSLRRPVKVGVAGTVDFVVVADVVAPNKNADCEEGAFL